MGVVCVQWKFPLDMVDICPNPDVVSENFHWTQTMSVYNTLHNQSITIKGSNLYSRRLML